MRARLPLYRLFVAVLAADLLLLFTRPALARASALNAATFLLEVFAILPPVMVLMGLLDVWVPRRMVESHLGRESGMLGSGVAMLLGTAAAGPLYAAFPVAVSLRAKGARIANIVIFLGTWAAVKVPMLVMESTFIGLRFALLRLVFTVPCILVMGYLMERIGPYDDPEAEPAQAEL